MARAVRRLARGRAAAVTLCAALAAPVPASGGEAPIASGVGARACSAFNFAVAKDSQLAIDAYVAWSQGFISAFNWSNVREQNVRVDAAGILNWLGRYCAAHPQAGVYSAVQELIRLNAR